jgi:hypothetical protein
MHALMFTLALPFYSTVCYTFMMNTKRFTTQTAMTSLQLAGGGTNFNKVKLLLTAMFNRVQLTLWKMDSQTVFPMAIPTVHSTVKSTAMQEEIVVLISVVETVQK